jgi:hypothetical protein
MYTVRLVAHGETMTAPLKVVMDPRVKTPEAELAEQFKVSKALYDDMLKATEALHEITVLRDQLKARSAQPAIASADNPLEEKLDKIAGTERGERGGPPRGGPARPATLGSVRMQLARLEHSIQNADFAPTTAQVEASETVSKPLSGLLGQWEQLKKTDLKALNATLQREHLAILQLNTDRINHDVEDQIEMGDED